MWSLTATRSRRLGRAHCLGRGYDLLSVRLSGGALFQSSILLEFARDLNDLVVRDVVKCIAIPVNGEALPLRFGEEFCGRFGKPRAAIGNDQPNAG